MYITNFNFIGGIIMNENIGSKGKGNDYRRVLKNIAKRKKQLKKSAKSKQKKKRVVQVSDGNLSFVPFSAKDKNSNVSITKNQTLSEKQVEQSEKTVKKNVEPIVIPNQSKKETPKQPSNPQKPVISPEKKSIEPTTSKKKEDGPVVIPDEAKKEPEKSAIPFKKEPLRPKKTKKTEIRLTDREKLENEALVQVLNEKVYDIEYELRDLAYREWVIRKQVDEVQEEAEAQRLVNELEEILVELQKLLADLDDNHYLFDQTYLEELGIQLEHKISNREYIGDNRFILYFDQLISRIEKAQDQVEKLKKETQEKGDELGVVEEDYDRYLEEYYQQEKFTDMVQEMVKRQEEIVRDIDDKLSRAVNTTERTKYVMEGVSKQTKNLMTGLAIGMFFPGIRGASAVALGVVATVTGIRHLVNPPYHTETEKIVTVDNYQKMIQNGAVDVSMARSLLSDNMRYLEDVMEQCEKEFSSYPAYDSIAADFQKLQVLLMEQDAYFAKIEDDLYQRQNMNKEQLKLIRQ